MTDRYKDAAEVGGWLLGPMGEIIDNATAKKIVVKILPGARYVIEGLESQ